MTGRAGAAAPPRLALLPVLLCDGELWAAQASALSDAAHCVVHDMTGGASLADLASAVLATAPARFALAGFSLGGYVAQEIIRQAPARVERLAPIDTAIRADTPERRATRRTLDAAARMPGSLKGLSDRMVGASSGQPPRRNSSLASRA